MQVKEGSALQAKGFPYTLMDLLGDRRAREHYLDGSYVTLRLTSGMYHRFHAPYDCRVEQVTYVSGDTWNVNPIALRRIENLFCKNERAIIRCRLSASDCLITLVPVAAILVASIRLHCVDVLLHLKYRGPNTIPCDARAAQRRGDGLVPARLHHDRLRAPGHGACCGSGSGKRDPHGPAAARALPAGNA